MARDFNNELDKIAFDFFYWFVRFEYALKENKFVRARRDGGAEADWGQFIDKHHGAYVLSAPAKTLFAAPPQFQVVIEDKAMKWVPVELADCKSELAQVVRLLKTMRNNLFHGGKKGPEGWSDPKRMKELLTLGKAILDEFAALAGMEADYTGP